MYIYIYIDGGVVLELQREGERRTYTRTHLGDRYRNIYKNIDIDIYR